MIDNDVVLGIVRDVVLDFAFSTELTVFPKAFIGKRSISIVELTIAFHGAI